MIGKAKGLCENLWWKKQQECFGNSFNWKCTLLPVLGWVHCCDNFISASFLSVFCSWAVQMNCSCNPVTTVVHLASLDDGREDAFVFYFDSCRQTPFSPFHGFSVMCILKCVYFIAVLGGTFIISLVNCCSLVWELKPFLFFIQRL